MKVDAHYYGVLGFCRALGFSREGAAAVAYASQFVDDAKVNHITIEGPIPEGIQYDLIDGKPSFFNMATCHSYTRIKTFNYDAMIHNTAAFHFVPGGQGQSFVRRMRCKEGGSIITAVLRDVLEEDDLIKLGVVLHAYADTFSHQGFSGLISKVNDIDKVRILKGFGMLADRMGQGRKWVREIICRWGDWLIPAYGHAQALALPDRPYLTWSYEYDYSDEFSEAFKSSGLIENKGRFFRAFKEIVRHLGLYLVKHPNYREREADLDSLMPLFSVLLARKMDNGRIRNWKKTLAVQGLFASKDREVLVYDKDRWLKEAFENFDRRRFDQRRVTGARLRQGFGASNWYQYYLAVGWYKERFLHHCAREGLVICR